MLFSYRIHLQEFFFTNRGRFVSRCSSFYDDDSISYWWCFIPGPFYQSLNFYIIVLYFILLLMCHIYIILILIVFVIHISLHFIQCSKEICTNSNAFLVRVFFFFFRKKLGNFSILNKRMSVYFCFKYFLYFNTHWYIRVVDTYCLN